MGLGAVRAERIAPTIKKRPGALPALTSTGKRCRWRGEPTLLQKGYSTESGVPSPSAVRCRWKGPVHILPTGKPSASPSPVRSDFDVA